uniref:Sulfhydryl oxidase n=1 Tax=Carcinus maenas virus 1 TaxID=2704945 RepID=A0A6G9HEM3_9VIRU|nr:sulfhydryl/thiol Oxidoreductase (ERV1/ALR/poxvirus E10 family) [Carcinus maenas virus 1]
MEKGWTSVVGPSCWRLLHYIAVTQKNNNPPKLKENLILSILESVPCNSCRKEALSRWQSRKEGIEMFVHNFHNDVNVKLNRSPFPITSLGMYRDTKEIKTIVTKDLFLTKVHSINRGRTWFEDFFRKILTAEQRQDYSRYERMTNDRIRKERVQFEHRLHQKIFGGQTCSIRK